MVKNTGKYARTKGHNFERRVAKDFREIGYSFCKTTRAASGLLDSCQIDLAFIPFNVQLKKGYEKQRPKPEKIFQEIDSRLKLNFPPEDNIHQNRKILIHSFAKHDFAYIEYDFLLELLKIKKEHEEKKL